MNAQRPRHPKDDHTLLAAMLLAEERGANWALRGFIDRSGHHLETSGDSEVVVAYNKLLVRAHDAFEYELVNGEGSLFNIDHPFNKQALKTWLKLPSSYLEAIERERDRKSTHIRRRTSAQSAPEGAAASRADSTVEG